MTRRVLVAVPDLFFFTRIQSTAALAGITIESCEASALVERCSSDPPDLVVMDLHAGGDPIERARELKRLPATSRIPILAFYSHVETALREQATQAGIDRVLPRSAFSARLAEWLAGPA
jgi:CheY-like chemotaxis protein